VNRGNCTGFKRQKAKRGRIIATPKSSHRAPPRRACRAVPRSARQPAGVPSPSAAPVGPAAHGPLAVFFSVHNRVANSWRRRGAGGAPPVGRGHGREQGTCGNRFRMKGGLNCMQIPGVNCQKLLAFHLAYAKSTISSITRRTVWFRSGAKQSFKRRNGAAARPLRLPSLLLPAADS